MAIACKEENNTIRLPEQHFNAFLSTIMLAKNNQTNPDWQIEEKIETKDVPSGAIMVPNYMAPGKSIWVVTWH